MAYRAAKAFRVTGSMEWMYETGVEALGVLIFGACNATWVQDFKILLGCFCCMCLNFAWTNLGDAQFSEATVKVLNNVTYEEQIVQAGKRVIESINPNFVESVNNIHNVVMVVQDTIGDRPRRCRVFPCLLFLRKRTGVFLKRQKSNV